MLQAWDAPRLQSVHALEHSLFVAVKGSPLCCQGVTRILQRPGGARSCVNSSSIGAFLQACADPRRLLRRAMCVTTADPAPKLCMSPTLSAGHSLACSSSAAAWGCDRAPQGLTPLLLYGGGGGGGGGGEGFGEEGLLLEEELPDLQAPQSQYQCIAMPLTLLNEVHCA